PCISRTGTLIFVRPSVKSVRENARTPRAARVRRSDDRGHDHHGLVGDDLRYDLARMLACLSRLALGLLFVAAGCTSSSRAHPPPQAESARARWQSNVALD